MVHIGCKSVRIREIVCLRIGWDEPVENYKRLQSNRKRHYQCLSCYCSSGSRLRFRCFGGDRTTRCMLRRLTLGTCAKIGYHSHLHSAKLGWVSPEMALNAPIRLPAIYCNTCTIHVPCRNGRWWVMKLHEASACRPVGIRGWHFFSQAQPSPKSRLQFRH
jgi:hypothetical protein